MQLVDRVFEPPLMLDFALDLITHSVEQPVPVKYDAIQII